MSEFKPDWWHLKEYGYAPGNYFNRCHRCQRMVSDVDKRVYCCKPCAIEAYTNHYQNNRYQS